MIRLLLVEIMPFKVPQTIGTINCLLNILISELIPLPKLPCLFILTEPRRKNEHTCPDKACEYGKYGIYSNHSRCGSANSADIDWLQVNCPHSGQWFTENCCTNLQLRAKCFFLFVNAQLKKCKMFDKLATIHKMYLASPTVLPMENDIVILH